ncbi:MAG TPA: sensor histidine kinase [Bryobacteraceae bacterium]|nr:sensor histidine kinase [Bryobacteraceae bacterium]
MNKGNLVLGAGYAVVLGLLVCSTVEAYRLQQTISRREAAVYQAHIVRENALSALRDCMWMGATYAREFLISGDAARFRSQIIEITQEGNQRAAVLRPEVSKSFSVYTAALRQLATGGPGDPQHAMGRIEQELLPLRVSALGTLERARSEMQNELGSAEQDLRRRQREIVWQLFIVLGGSLLTGLVIAALTTRYARNWQRERAARAAEMAHLSARLQEVQEEERRFLARELHDEVGQTLTALRMELGPASSAIPNSALRDRMRTCQELAEHAVHIVRHISLMLRPSLLDDLGLDAALEWHLNEFSRRSGIQSEFVADDAMPDLSDETRTCIYRVAQEALNNCEKYSRATKARLVVRFSEESIMIEISDNGAGFQLTPRGMPARGTGLLGIRERVSRLQGSTLIDSNPGAGTRIVVTLPLDGVMTGSKQREKVLL